MAYVLSKEFVWKDVGDQVVVLNLGSGNYHSLNLTASLIWRGLMEQRPLEDILEDLCSRFQVDLQTSGRDAEELIGRFVIKGMITPMVPGA